MSRLFAVSTFVILAASPALAFADLPTGPRPRPNGEPADDPVPPPEPTPPTEPPMDTGPMEAEPPAEGGEDAKAEGGDTKVEEAKAEDKAEDKSGDGGPKPVADADKKGGSCSVEDETNSLLGFAAFALLISGVALRRREPRA